MPRYAPDNRSRPIRTLARRRRLTVLFLCLFAVHGAFSGPGESTKPVAERMAYARSTKEKALALNDSSLLAEGHYLYGKAFAFAGDYITSQRYFLNSLRIQEALGDSDRIARLYVRLSENERGQGHYGDAMQYARTALAISKRINATLGITIALQAIGSIHEYFWETDNVKNTASYDTAYECYREVERLMLQENNRTGIADASQLLGGLLSKKKDLRCFEYLQKALTVFADENMYGDQIRTKIDLASAHLRFGQLPMALKQLKAAQQLYEETQLREIPLRLALYQGYSQYYRAIGAPDSTLVYRERLHEIQLAQANSDQKTILEWLRKEHEMQQREKEMEQHKQQVVLQASNLQLQQKFILFLCLLVILTIVAGAFFFILNRRNRRTSQLNAQLVQEQGHRIKNNLQAVSALLQLQSRNLTDPAARSAMLDSKLRVQSIALLQRRLYDERLGPEVNLSEYLSELTDQILAACGYPHLDKTVVIDNTSLNPERALPIALILNELITNACKYAFADHPAPRLTVSCSRTNKRLLLTVSDNGPGFEPSKDRPPASFGLQLIHMQAEQLYARYTFERVETGTKFRMELTV